MDLGNEVIVCVHVLLRVDLDTVAVCGYNDTQQLYEAIGVNKYILKMACNII